MRKKCVKDERRHFLFSSTKLVPVVRCKCMNDCLNCGKLYLIETKVSIHSTITEHSLWFYILLQLLCYPFLIKKNEHFMDTYTLLVITKYFYLHFLFHSYECSLAGHSNTQYIFWSFKNQCFQIYLVLSRFKSQSLL